MYYTKKFKKKQKKYAQYLKIILEKTENYIIIMTIVQIVIIFLKMF